VKSDSWCLPGFVTPPDHVLGGSAVTNSTAAVRPAKPRPDFPLFPHRNGRWAKKVCGKFCYFGKWSEDPKGEAAIRLWADQKDDLLAGRTPRANREGFIMASLCNHFLTAKEQQRDAGDITPRSFADYFATCKMLICAFGKNRLVDDLATDDFQTLRASFAKRYGVHRLGNEVQRTRTVFKYGYDAGLIEKPMRFGPTFKRPTTRIMRAHRQKHGNRLFEAGQLQAIIDKAGQPLKSMILLGINCGFGNQDCGTLPQSALDLDKAWVDFPRPKTAVERRCPLWPETVKALREAIEERAKPKRSEHAKLVFITRYGQPWAKENGVVQVTKGDETKTTTPVDSPVTKEMRKLLDELKLYRPGLGFYALRHSFETVAGGSLDQVAVDHIMGHVDSSMAGTYREAIEDRRLLAVSNHVRKWLFPKATKKRK
jgi:integrase